MGLFKPPHEPGKRLDLDGIPVRLKVDGRARRISLRIDPARREVVAIAPRSRELKAALRFAETRRTWALRELARVAPARSIGAGQHLTLFGERCVVRADGRRPRVIAPATPSDAVVLAGCGAETADPRLVEHAIRQLGRQRFAGMVTGFCRELAVDQPRLALADAKSRWGSCTPARNGRSAGLRLSWRLALAPLDVAAYVAAHECAHLLESNHGPRFWGHVERLVGDPRVQRAWLRAHGAGLHTFAAL